MRQVFKIFKLRLGEFVNQRVLVQPFFAKHEYETKEEALEDIEASGLGSQDYIIKEVYKP